MIYCTGDIHGDKLRFGDKNLKKLKRGDSLIICGDFGLIWDGSEQEQKFLKKLGRKRYNILFVDGAHENFELLNRYPIEEWQGGKTRLISGRLRYLCRGEIFDIDKVKVFAFGGGRSEDYSILDVQNDEELSLPTDREISDAINHLDDIGREVDYIVSYEPPPILEDYAHTGNLDVSEKTQLNALFDEIVKYCTYKKWIFGKCHKNRIVSPKYTAVYTSVIKLDTPKPEKKKLFSRK